MCVQVTAHLRLPEKEIGLCIGRITNEYPRRLPVSYNANRYYTQCAVHAAAYVHVRVKLAVPMEHEGGTRYFQASVRSHGDFRFRGAFADFRCHDSFPSTGVHLMAGWSCVGSNAATSGSQRCNFSPLLYIFVESAPIIRLWFRRCITTYIHVGGLVECFSLTLILLPVKCGAGV